MNYVVAILHWLKKNITLKDLLYWIVIAIIIGLLCSSIQTCNRNSNTYEKNLKALTEQIDYYQSENGALIATKTAFESNIKELKIANNDLYEELQDLKIKMNDITSGVHIDGNIDFGKQDTIYIIEKDHSGGTSNFLQRFDFSNQWRILDGKLSLQNDSITLAITNDKVLFDYTIAIDKNNKIYVKSDNPYVKYNEISGFVVPKQNKTVFSIGPTVGIGYGLINQKPDFYIGIAASLKLFEF